MRHISGSKLRNVIVALGVLALPWLAPAVICENDVQDHPQLLGLSPDGSKSAMRNLRKEAGGAQTFGVVLYLCKTGGACESFEVSQRTDGDRQSPTPRDRRKTNLKNAKAAIASAQVKLDAPIDAFTEESDESLSVAAQAAHGAGLGAKASLEFSDAGDLLLRSGNGRSVMLQPAQTDLGEAGPYPVSGWALLSNDGSIVAHGGYRDKLCRRGLLISSLSLTEVTGRSEKRLGLEAFHAGKTREAQKHFERATQAGSALSLGVVESNVFEPGFR